MILETYNTWKCFSKLFTNFSLLCLQTIFGNHAPALEVSGSLRLLCTLELCLKGVGSILATESYFPHELIWSPENVGVSVSAALISLTFWGLAWSILVCHHDLHVPFSKLICLQEIFQSQCQSLLSNHSWLNQRDDPPLLIIFPNILLLCALSIC